MSECSLPQCFGLLLQQWLVRRQSAAAGPPLLCTCRPLLISPGGPDISVMDTLIEVNRKNSSTVEWGISRSRASDICVTLRCHLVYEFELVTSGVEETELISSSTAPPMGLFFFLRTDCPCRTALPSWCSVTGCLQWQFGNMYYLVCCSKWQFVSNAPDPCMYQSHQKHCSFFIVVNIYTSSSRRASKFFCQCSLHHLSAILWW